MQIKSRLSFLLLSLIVIMFLSGCIYKQPVKIDFNSMGGSVVDRIYVNGVITPPTDPSRTGYQFDGWYLDEAYTKPYTFSTVPEKSLILYAKWKLKSYTIQFMDHNGDRLGEYQVDHGNDLKPPKVPIREGYTFHGWSRNLSNITDDMHVHALYRSNLTGKIDVDKEILRMDVEESIQTAIDSMIEFYHYEPYYVLPSTGDVNILVIPIEFPNDRFTNEELNQLEKANFSTDMHYETLQAYYQQSSYGKLNLHGEVLSPYLAQNIDSYYDRYVSHQNEDATGVDLLIEEAIAYYKNSNLNVDLSRYDTEGDGVIDGIHFVYASPVDESLESIYWAYQYYYTPTSGVRNEAEHSWNGYEVDSYVFSGIDFFNEGGNNAWTIIHETGHLFGLDDYYDYTEDDLNQGGLGGADVMDDTMGEHNPFSKLVLDWIEPLIVENSMTITIDAFEASGDTILLTDKFTRIFDEYYLLSYYTPTGLNAYNRYLTESGLIIYELNAQLPNDYDLLDKFSYFFEYNNSTTKEKFIQIVEADQDNSIEERFVASNSDLLKEGMSIDLKLSNDQACTLTVDQLTPTSLTLTIEFQ